MKQLTHNQIDYNKLLLEQQALLTRLVQDQYITGPVRLTQIAEYTFEDRGIYRVDVEDGYSYVLRAFRYDVKNALLSQVALLAYLEQQGYPAPHVLHTISGTSFAFYENWMTLMVSYIEGSLADFSSEHLTRLGAQLGMLHTHSEQIANSTSSFAFPTSRLHPHQLPAQIAFSSKDIQLPSELQKLYKASATTLGILQQATLLPITLLHGDCWPHNAVISRHEEITLIDWDCAGLGPAVLDVGYLLLTCHLGKPQLPTMRADPALITAVVHGYCQQRQLNRYELAVLHEAVHFETARRVLTNDMLANVQSGRHEDVRIQKELARFAISDEIATIAHNLFVSD